MKFEIKSPAKVILFGEHFVVYNQKGIVAAIKPYNQIEIDFKKSSFPSFEYYSNIKKYSFKISQKDKKNYHFLVKLYKFFINKYPKLKKFKIIVKIKKMWALKGVGNSSALSSSFALAIEKFLKNKINKKKIFEYTQVGDGFAHKKPSGIDASAIVYGGTVEFSKNKKPKKIFFKKIKGWSFILIDTKLKDKKTSLTSKQIQKFAAKKGHKNISKYQKIYKKAKKALQNANVKDLIDAIKENQKLLEIGGISTKTISEVIKILNDDKIEGVKITGAGGKGSCLIALVPNKDIKKIQKKLIMKGFRSYRFEISSEGIIEKNSH